MNSNSESFMHATLNRPLKLIYVGAGISGIIAAIQFRKAVPHLELVIYEKNPELGGTWYENNYPGCACGPNSFQERRLSQVLNFTNYAAKYFERTVYSSDCNRSSIHAIKALGYVRWEGFEITPYDGNEFGWFENGWAAAENTPDINPEAIPWYLDRTSFLDIAQLQGKE
ncbi:hypothetical protein EYZ11_004879 [Aspergillus tanneri]|uniref:FAD/NAD(P)-binding domain-containing protein n=1 Tax=Aspergillus tanneri TaxID=1220188 RepID=A0A4S3JJH2_9EURO|nr:hypothetical protein EYZ11_004879 [Aspergillus tanneri]